MARQHKCLECKEANIKAKQEEPPSKVQWTFMSTDAEVVALLPFFMKVQFPCVLSHRSGLDLQLARIIRPLVDKGSTFEAISGMLRELHSLTYFDEMIQHQSEKLLGVDKMIGQFGGIVLSYEPVLSNFSDKGKYSGSIPTSGYLGDFYKDTHNGIRSYLDRMQKWMVNCKMLSIDASYKCMKKLTRVNGKAVCETVQSILGGDGLIRSQVATVTDGHQQLVPSPQAINQTNQELGKESTKLVRTDNPAKDFNFLLDEAFPDSLPKVQSELKEIADRMDVLEREIAATRQHSTSSPNAAPIPLARAAPEKSLF
jgi:hypothetical protein